MRKITKKTLKRIKAGYHDDLMEAIEFLLDSYNEDKFDQGYKSCLADMSVRAQRLSEYINEMAEKYGEKCADGIPTLTIDKTAKAIENYFEEALKQ